MQLPPPIHGAGMVNSLVANSEIIKGNYDIDIVNFQFAKSVKGVAKISFRKLVMMVGYTFQIIWKFLSGKPDLVYFTIAPLGVAFYRDAAYVLILKTLGAKLVFHLHAQGIRELTEKSGWNKRLYRMVFKNTRIVCLSERLTADISGVYDAQPFVVPNGIHTREKYKRADHSDNSHTVRILYLSNLFTSKGVLILLEALQSLKKQGYQFEAKFVGAPGDISLESFKNKVEAEDMADCVEVAGPIYGEDKFAEFQQADIFVHPTYYDAFPLVILEAMQFGLPVVSTYEGGIPNMVEHEETGFLVETKNAKMLEEKIAVLLEDINLRTSMGDKGYASFKKNFTVQEFEHNMDRVFKTALGLKTEKHKAVAAEVNFDLTDQLN